MRKHSLKMMIPVLLLTLSATTGISSAYLTAYDETKNKISVGNNTTEITEEFPDPTPIEPDEIRQYSKKVQVTNLSARNDGSSVDCYVRVSLGYSNSDIKKALTLTNLDTENWTLLEDGFYYYSKVLKEGESTTPLFTGFSIDGSKVEKEYLDLISAFEIQVYEESIQAFGANSCFEAWQKETDIV